MLTYSKTMLNVLFSEGAENFYRGHRPNGLLGQRCLKGKKQTLRSDSYGRPCNFVNDKKFRPYTVLAKLTRAKFSKAKQSYPPQRSKVKQSVEQPGRGAGSPSSEVGREQPAFTTLT